MTTDTPIVPKCETQCPACRQKVIVSYERAPRPGNLVYCPTVGCRNKGMVAKVPGKLVTRWEKAADERA